MSSSTRPHSARHRRRNGIAAMWPACGMSGVTLFDGDADAARCRSRAPGCGDVGYAGLDDVLAQDHRAWALVAGDLVGGRCGAQPSRMDCCDDRLTDIHYRLISHVAAVAIHSPGPSGLTLPGRIALDHDLRVGGNRQPGDQRLNNVHRRARMPPMTSYSHTP